MSDTIVVSENRTPVHLWIVAILSVLWNGMGALDYFMTRTRGAEWINSMMEGVDGARYMAYIDNFPIWASFGWGLGVWLGLAGAVLLLMRNRLAVPAFALSLVGAVIGIGYQIMNPVDIPAMSEGFGGIVNYIVIAIAAAQLVYARKQAQTGVLR